MLLKFRSKVNEIASGIIYELHELDDKNYLIKWSFDTDNGVSNHSMKQTRKSVDNFIKKGLYIVV